MDDRLLFTMLMKKTKFVKFTNKNNCTKETEICWTHTAPSSTAVKLKHKTSGYCVGVGKGIITSRVSKDLQNWQSSDWGSEIHFLKWYRRKCQVEGL